MERGVQVLVPMARAVAVRPRALLLDEPLTA
jgi:ABC-type sulfate/molybdate transport systems ATPase subunit